jgi:uncharacterized protein YndB with AHSA1/START domain
MASDGKGEILVARVFEAPPELVYRAFADPDQLCLWFGPEGFSVPCETVQIDARPGGFQRFVMVSDDDPTIRSEVNATLSEVVENQLLVGHEDVAGLPGTADSRRLHLRLEFRDEPGGRTLLELRQGPFTHEQAGDARSGWESSFTKLDALLERSL